MRRDYVQCLCPHHRKIILQNVQQQPECEDAIEENSSGDMNFEFPHDHDEETQNSEEEDDLDEEEDEELIRMYESRTGIQYFE